VNHEPGPLTDPVRIRRAKYARAASMAQRIGYSLFAVAVVAFFIGFFAGFTDPVVTVIVAALAIGSILLAPAIVTSYAVKAAERDDLDNGR
jgi:predicted cation transporter